VRVCEREREGGSVRECRPGKTDGGGGGGSLHRRTGVGLSYCCRQDSGARKVAVGRQGFVTAVTSRWTRECTRCNHRQSMLLLLEANHRYGGRRRWMV
jgi:hypothetical protein